MLEVLVQIIRLNSWILKIGFNVFLIIFFFFFQKLSNMVNKQIPYPYTNTALLMSYDWPFIFKRSWFARYMTVSVGVGVFAFFQMRKIEIAFHEKCKAKAAADGGH